MSESYLDKPATDGTKQAHPAYWRGRARGTSEILRIVKNIVTGEDTGEGEITSPVIEAARRAILAYHNVLATASKKTTPFSKQAREALNTAKKEVEKVYF